MKDHPLLTAYEKAARRALTASPARIGYEAAGTAFDDARAALNAALSPSLIQPADPTEGCPISSDGPHAITEHRRWLARQLLDSKLDDAEAFGIVRHHPAISDLIQPQGEERS